MIYTSIIKTCHKKWRKIMNKKDIIFLATALMISSHKLTATADAFKPLFLDWYRVLSEIYEEIPTDSQT